MGCCGSKKSRGDAYRLEVRARARGIDFDAFSALWFSNPRTVAVTPCVL